MISIIILTSLMDLKVFLAIVLETLMALLLIEK